MNFIDNFLNRITMYRLVLYYLLVLLGAGVILAWLGLLPFSPVALIFSTGFLIITCVLTNDLFAWAFKVPTNAESAYITALILASIITPGFDNQTIFFLLWASVLAMGAKYILAINKKHIFNPSAIAMVITGYALHQAPSWWPGTLALLPVTAIGGALIIRKIRRFDMTAVFLAAALITSFVLSLVKGVAPLIILERSVVQSPLVFFATIMLTEPLTTPPAELTQLIYGALVGILVSPQFHIGSFFTTPELALVIGNVFSYITSPKIRVVLTLQKIETAGQGILDFVFTTSQKFSFQAGQYLEWTLATPHSDSRGNRRYFTIASAPTENTIRMGVKFYDKPSLFKQELHKLKPGDTIIASQLAGSFTLPKDPNQKLVFIAGGIGVTPFRSHIQYLIDTNQKRDIVLLYSNNTVSEIAYQNVFDQGAASFGLKTVYALTDTTQVPAGWQGETGFINAEMITKHIPDFKERKFYLSGPHGMVVTFENLLKQMGVPSRQIKVDYFPGFA